MYATTRGQVFRSTDGGLNWTSISASLTSKIHQVTTLAIDFSDPDTPNTPTTLYAGLIGFTSRRVIFSGGVFKSVDAGASWTAIDIGLEGIVTVLVIDPSAPATIYAGTVSGGVFKSTNGGESWAATNNGFPSPAIRALVLDPHTPSTIYAGTATRGIVKSIDAGASWTLINSGLPPFSSAGALVIDPLTPTTVYAGVDNAVFRSLDAGASWTQLGQPLPGDQVDALALDPTDLTLYAGTAEGVFDFQLVPEVLENPQDASFQSGVGVISGWVCDAETITIEIDGSLSFAAAYSTSREDTFSICGDVDNGFGLLLINWNSLGDGAHEVRALANGEEFGRATVTVTTLGTEFLTGATGSFTLSDFPHAGTDVMLVWQEALQNFVIANVSAPSSLLFASSQSETQALSLGVLENPQTNSFQSGIGVISGWVCDADQVAIDIDGAVFEAAYGSSREDTRSVCDDANNGFGLLVNWNVLGDGPHEVRALADGEEFGQASVEVTTFGQEFLTGAEGSFGLTDFPQTGTHVTVEWQEALQNFVITAAE